MERNFETVMIEQCAPVLAGLKPAGLFRYETRDCADLARRVRSWNEQLASKGLSVRVLKGCVRTHQFLIYVYREARLRAIFADEAVRAFLAREGYQLPQEQEQTGIMLTQLGFIENRGRNFTCCGCWKAYGDPNAARRHFAQLSKCTAVYLRLFHSGTPISRLAVAA